MTAAVILQARMTSTRLPGKVLQVVAGCSILEWVARSCLRVPGIDVVCVAAPESDTHEPVAIEARRLGLPVVRGSEHDVLDRFRVATAAMDATEIMRVTTDCPLIDPVLCGEVLARLRSEGADYASNNDPAGFPHGLDCEVFTRATLERAAVCAHDADDREHVTPWLRREPSVRRVSVQGPGGDCVHWRWTVDFPEDLAFFSAIAERLGDDVSDWRRVSALLEAEPGLHEINRARRQR
jgi:spore coat polysaccharide biosynthesis protein SpsF